jgi:hypothetical protein
MSPHNSGRRFHRLIFLLSVLPVFGSFIFGQSSAVEPKREKTVELGSATAKNGFKNEDEIAAKFNNWTTDRDAQNWLTAMRYPIRDVKAVRAAKPHGEKADIEVTIETSSKTKTEGISIKLVSSPNGFNQIDKRWLSHYATMWNMPLSVQNPLKKFVGETAPAKPGRASNRMFLDELEPLEREAVVTFFTTDKQDIVSDLFEGDGAHAAGWVMVALKATPNTRWVLRQVDEVIKYYSEGPVTINSGGNLKIGQITMQRKGGDGGRETAKMLQFKINPALLLYNLK